MEGLCWDMQFAVITFYVCCGKQQCAAGKGKFRLDLQLNCAESTQLPLVPKQMNLLFLHDEPLPNILHLFVLHLLYILKHMCCFFKRKAVSLPLIPCSITLSTLAVLLTSGPSLPFLSGKQDKPMLGSSTGRMGNPRGQGTSPGIFTCSHPCPHRSTFI